MPAGPSPLVQADPFDPAARAASRRRSALAVVLALAILAIAFFGLSAAGLLRIGGAATPAVLRAEGQVQTPSLRVHGATTPPALAQTAERKVMPPEVRAWLEHLEEAERRKNDLHLRQIAEMRVFEQMLGALGAGIGSLDPFDDPAGGEAGPDDVAKGKFADLRPEWHELVRFFESKPPPEECRPLRDDYFRALNEIPGMMGDVMNVLNAVKDNPAAALESATRLKQKSYGDIDRHLETADGRLQAICDRYDVRKWFNIKSDAGAGILGRVGS